MMVAELRQCEYKLLIMNRLDTKDESHLFVTNRGQVILLILLVFPLLVNDFANIYFWDNWRWWYIVDLGMVKPFQLGLMFWMFFRGYARPGDFGLRKIRPLAFIFYTVILTVGGTILLFNSMVFLNKLIGLAPLGGYPSLGNHWFRWVDLTLDLALVGFLEETIFRGYMETVLRRLNCGTFLIVLISSVCFGLIHWSNGLHSVVATALFGAVYMGFYLKLRSTLPLIVAHYLVDFIAFSSLVPINWFLYIHY